MFIIVIGAIVFVGLFCIGKEILYPYKPVVEIVRKNRPSNYDWVSGNDHGGVILDEEKDG
jgi:hypothetical protein